jgi:hypothetical protein
LHTVTYTVRKHPVEHTDLMTSDSAGRDLCAAGWQSEFKLDGFCNCRAPATCSAFTGAGPKLTTRRSCVVSSRSSKTSHRMGSTSWQRLFRRSRDRCPRSVVRCRVAPRRERFGPANTAARQSGSAVLQRHEQPHRPIARLHRSVPAARQSFPGRSSASRGCISMSAAASPLSSARTIFPLSRPAD